MTRVVLNQNGRKTYRDVPDHYAPPALTRLITMPDAIATADFKNGVYTLNGHAATLADLWIQHVDVGPWSPAEIIGGSGWKSTNNTGPRAADPLMEMLTLADGFTWVADIVTDPAGTGGFDMDAIDIIGWSDGISTRSRSNSTEYINYDGVTPASTPAAYAAGVPLRIVSSIMPDGCRTVLSNGQISEAPAPDLNMLNTLFMWTKGSDTGGSFAYMRKVSILPPIDELDVLTVLAATT